MFAGFKPIPINEHEADFAASAMEITLDGINYRVGFPALRLKPGDTIDYVCIAQDADNNELLDFP